MRVSTTGTLIVVGAGMVLFYAINPAFWWMVKHGGDAVLWTLK